MEIRRLGEEDAAAWWNLRLEGLRAEPSAFGMAAEDHETTPVELAAQRFRDSDKDSFTLGAFEGGRLLGMATFIRKTGRKERHKGNIYGVYVTAAEQGRGLGRALIAALLSSVRQDPTIEQVLLAVGARQTAARRLYQSFGFEKYGTEPKALKAGSVYVDEELMVLML